MKAQPQAAPKAPSNANFLQKFLTAAPQGGSPAPSKAAMESRSCSTGKLPPLTARPGLTKIALGAKQAHAAKERVSSSG